MKTIAKHIGSMDFFQQPFIALQSLYVDQWELLQQGTNGDNEGNGKSNIDLTNSSLSEEQAQEAINKISTETAENIEQVNNIFLHAVLAMNFLDFLYMHFHIFKAHYRIELLRKYICFGTADNIQFFFGGRIAHGYFH